MLAHKMIIVIHVGITLYRLRGHNGMPSKENELRWYWNPSLIPEEVPDPGSPPQLSPSTHSVGTPGRPADQYSPLARHNELNVSNPQIIDQLGARLGSLLSTAPRQVQDYDPFGQIITDQDEHFDSFGRPVTRRSDYVPWGYDERMVELERSALQNQEFNFGNSSVNSPASTSIPTGLTFSDVVREGHKQSKNVASPPRTDSATRNFVESEFFRQENEDFKSTSDNIASSSSPGVLSYSEILRQESSKPILQKVPADTVSHQGTPKKIETPPAKQPTRPNRPSTPPSNYDVRIHEVRADVHPAQIRDAVQEAFGETPVNVRFISYKDERDTKLTIVKVTGSLREKIKECPIIELNGWTYKIDATAQVTRCAKCHLLGHGEDTCGGKARTYPPPNEPCIDCTNYNRVTQKRKLDRKKHDEQHPTNDYRCPTRVYYKLMMETESFTDDKVPPSTVTEEKSESSPSAETLFYTPPSTPRTEEASSSTNKGTATPSQSSPSSARSKGKRPITPDKPPLSLPSDRYILIEPRSSQLMIDVQAEIERVAGIEDLVITRKFPSIRAAIIWCRTEQELQRVKRKVAASHTLRIRPKIPFMREVRIYDVEKDVLKNDVLNSVRATYNRYPEKVLFFDLSATISEDNKTRTAVIRVLPDLLKDMEDSPYIRIRGRRYKIDVSLKVIRCARCRLLGHIENFCYNDPRPPPSDKEPCIDCVAYNSTRSEWQHKETSHETGAQECTTLSYYLQKWVMKTQARVPSNAEEKFVKNEQEESPRVEEICGDEEIIDQTGSNRASAVIRAKIRGVNVLTEFFRINADTAMCEILDAQVSPSGELHIEFHTERGAVHLHEMLASSETIEMVFS